MLLPSEMPAAFRVLGWAPGAGHLELDTWSWVQVWGQGVVERAFQPSSTRIVQDQAKVRGKLGPSAPQMHPTDIGDPEESNGSGRE